MKKITLLLILLTASMGFSQQVILEDFEGTPPTITLNNGLGSATITTDPAMGPNGNVLEIVSSAAGDPWQQADLLMQNGMIDLTTDTTVTVEIYSSNPINILAKVDVGATPSATDSNHGGTGWETLVFDFSDPKDNTAAADGAYGQISFFPSWAGDGTGDSGDNPDWFVAVDGTTFYVDNIAAETPATATCTDGIQNGDETGVDCGGTSCPDCPPPSPPAVLEDFEGTPPSITLTNGLGSATITTDPAMGPNSNVLEIVSSAAGDPWQQADLLIQNNTMDLTSDTTVSVDIYSTSAINILAKVDDGGTPSATDSNHGGSGWETLVFDFSDPKDNTGAADGQYAKISFFPSWAGDGTGDSGDNPDWFVAVDGKTFYVDNITAVPGTPLSTIDSEITSFSVYPNPSLNSWNIESNQTINSVVLFDILGKRVLSLNPKTENITIDGTSLTSGLYFAKINSNSGTKTVKLIKE